MTNLAQSASKKRLMLPRTQNSLDSEMSHSWSSALHWKCSIPARVSRVRIPSTPPGIKNAPHGVFFIPVGVVVWTKRSQSVIAGFGASVDENEPFGEV